MVEYASSCLVVWQLAAAEAERARAGNIEPAHLLLAICKLCDAIESAGETVALEEPLASEVADEVAALRGALAAAGVAPATFRHGLRGLLPPGLPEAPRGTLHRSPAARRIFGRAEERVAAEGDRVMRPRHLLSVLLAEPEPSWAALAEGERPETIGPPPSPIPDAADGIRTRVGRTPYLDRFGRDLTELARHGRLAPLIGRRPELEKLARVLVQQRRGNAILVGDAGVGKTCIVEGLAQRVAGPRPPASLAGTRLVELSMAALVAGTRYRGEFEERLEAVIAELAGDVNIVAFIDEIHTLLGVGGGDGALDASNMLKPALSRGDIRVIGATTIDEYRLRFERDQALERRFQVVWVDEPSPDEAIEILRGVRPRLEQHHSLSIQDDGIQAAVELSVRYMRDLRLPDKALTVLDEACAAQRIDLMSSASVGACAGPLIIGRNEVARVVAQHARVLLERLTRDDVERLRVLPDALSETVMGQPSAIDAVTRAIRASRGGAKRPNRPAGVLLFVGATGTGKTQLAKALTWHLFDDEQALIRVDMSEYRELHMISRLIGAPPGYIGHEIEGQLTGAVRSRPYSVVLLDEIEKAHPDVLNLFLQVFDDGLLTDARGRAVSFADTVIILTSNLGAAADNARTIGFHAPASDHALPAFDEVAYRARIDEALRGTLRPEFLNRIDEVVYFNPLSQETLQRLVRKLASGLEASLIDHGIRLSVADEACDLLAREGFDLRFGARELERTFDRLVRDPLVEALFDGRMQDGAALIVDARAGTIVFDDAFQTRPAGLGPSRPPGTD